MLLVFLLTAFYIAVTPAWALSEAQVGDVRLADGDATYKGRVELFYAGDWGTICDYGWSSNEARVVCRQLGLQYRSRDRSSVGIGGAYFGEGTGSIWITHAECDGNEDNILGCIRNDDFLSNYCDHTKDAGVICSEITDVRLIGPVENIGRVEVLYDDIWIPICQHTESYADEEWDTKAAAVVCKQLGFAGGGVAYTNSAVNNIGLSSSVPFRANDFRCRNFVNTSQDCSYEVEVQSCLDDQQAAVICFESDVRLVDKDVFYQGRVEIFNNDQWGTVCDNYWSHNDAKVVCRQLGLPYDEVTDTREAYFGEGSGPIWLDNLQCEGTEDKITDCRHAGFGNHNCEHDEDAGVTCSACRQPESLGVKQSGSIKDDQITALSEYHGFQASKGRLNGPQSWLASQQTSEIPWIQVDFVNDTTMTGILIQGSGDSQYNAWVSDVRIQAGDSKRSLTYIMNQNKTEIFSANTDIDTTVPIMFSVPIIARYLRIEAIQCNYLCCLRFDVIGCLSINECELEGTCNVNAICSDFTDGYKCTCKDGFTGNGFQCEAKPTSTEASAKTSFSAVSGNPEGTTSLSTPANGNGDKSKLLTKGNIGVIVGVVAGALVVIVILVLVLAWVIFRRKREGKPDGVASNDMTVLETDATPTADAEINNGTMHPNQTFETDGEAERDTENTNNENDEYTYADVDQQGFETNAIDNIYTYAEMPPGDTRPSAPLPTTSSQEGWVDNSIYTTSREEADVQLISSAVDNQEEGWADNTIYGD